MADEGAHVNIDQLDRLAEDLKKYSSAIASVMEDLDSGLNRLGNTFRDDTYFDFRAHYQSARQQLQAFVEETRRYWPILEADSADLRSARNRQVD